jgi:hypothetical protein
MDPEAEVALTEPPFLILVYSDVGNF